MPDSEKHIEWVKARSECTLRKTIELLGVQINEAVDEFKKENPNLSRLCKYSVEVLELKVRICKQVTGPGRLKCVILDVVKPDVICVHEGTGPIENILKDNLFKAQVTWDVRKNRCILVVGEKKYKPWQITQKVLSDFLFEDIES